MNFLKILRQHLFQRSNAPSEREEGMLSALETNFSIESFSGETLSVLMQNAGFEEFAAEDESLRFRFDGQEALPENDPEQFALQVSELLLEFTPPSFPDEGFELEEDEMQGLDTHFWEKYVFDEDFAKDIPNFAEPEFQPLPVASLTPDERESAF